MAGLKRTTLEQFIGGDVATNKALLYDVLTGIPGARRDIVLLNAAAVLVAAGLAGDLKARRSHGRGSNRLGPGRSDARKTAAVRGEVFLKAELTRLPAEWLRTGKILPAS